MNLNSINVNIIDIAFLSVILISMLLAYSRGLLKEIFALSNWILAGWISLTYYLKIKLFFIKYISPEVLAEITSFLILFLLSIGVGTFISHFITSKFKKTALAPTDKILGLIFGFLRALIIISIVSLVLINTLWKHKTFPDRFTGSYSYPIIIKSINFIEIIFPNNSSLLDNQNLNLNDIKDSTTNKIFEKLLEPPIKVEENTADQYYKPSETEAMDRLINIETIDDSNE